jgi:hypothetical protein
MDSRPFTLEEATEICEDFEDLLDTEFKVGESPLLLIEQVTIAPFLETDKISFVERYDQMHDTQNALNFYSGPDYDVLLITSAGDEAKCAYIDIRTFAGLKGINYSFPG